MFLFVDLQLLSLDCARSPRLPSRTGGMVPPTQGPEVSHRVVFVLPDVIDISRSLRTTQA